MRRRSFLAFSAAVAAGSALPSFALDRRSSGDLALPWDRVADDVYVTPTSIPGGNVLLLRSDERVVVVDSKFAYLGGAIAADAVVLGKDRPISLVNTHHHGDHTGGNAAFAEFDGIWAQKNASARIAAQLANYKQQAMGGVREIARAMPDDARLFDLATGAADAAGDYTEADFVPTDSLRGGGGQIDAGDAKVNLRHRGPGHTDNDLLVHIPEHNVLHTGDLVFNGFHPFFDANGGVDPRGWIKSLVTARGLCEPDTIVIPGHGPRGGPGIIDGQIAYLEALLEAVGKEIDAGTTLDDAKAKEYPFFGDRGFKQLAPIAVGVVYEMLVEEREQG